MVKGTFDAPAPGAKLEPGEIAVSGWVFDEAGAPLVQAQLLVDDGSSAQVQLGIERGDVAAAFPSVDGAGVAGFEAMLDLRSGAGPERRIALMARPQEGPWQEVVAADVTVSDADSHRQGARRRAVFTIVQNEPLMLPLWLGYYGRYFDADDTYVLDHDSTDGSTDLLEGAHRVPIHRRGSFDHRWLRGTVEAFQAFLLRSYDAVLFTEVDEFVIADPRKHAGLDGYIEGISGLAARCSGFNVVHQPDEPPLDFAQPMLAQRRYWHASREYSKRLLSRMPLRWSEGFHTEYAAPDDPPDPELMLVHLHRVDYDTCRARHTSSAARDWNEEDVAKGLGRQNRIVEADEFEEWFRRGEDLESPRELIPDHVRAML